MKSSHPHSKISPQHPSVRKHIASIPFIPPPSLRNYSDWIQFPQDAIPTVFLIINCLLMPFKWTFWTNRAILKAESSDIRGRLCNQYAVLGSTAGMLVTVSAAAFYSPPHSINPSDEYLVPVYGSLMFSASIMFVSYIVLSLTVLFPLIESAQDEVLSYIFHDLLKLMQSIEGLVFTMGINLFALGLLVSIPIIYSWQMFYIFCGVTAAVYRYSFLHQIVFNLHYVNSQILIALSSQSNVFSCIISSLFCMFQFHCRMYDSFIYGNRSNNSASYGYNL